MNRKMQWLRNQLLSLNLQGMIITNPVNIKYLTNIQAEGILLVTRKENIFITDGRYVEAVHNTLTLFDEIVVYDVRGLTKDDFENFFMFCENVGFEENYITYAKYKEYMHKYKINSLVETENMIEKQRMIKDEEEIAAILITTQEFYDLLNSPNSLSEDELVSVNLYYAYLGDLILYEEYLVPELKKMLQDFRAYVYELEYGDVHVPLNEKQREATAKLKEMEEAKKSLEESVTEEKINDGVKKLQRVMPADNYVAKENEDNAGMVSVIQVVAFIIGISIILTAVTLYLIS